MAATKWYDVLEGLFEASWRGIGFPTTKFRMSIAHDLVEHKYWGVDGARVESTGLAPLRFSFSAPLLNGIEPGGKETWKWAELYPDQFRKLVAAFQRKDVGWLVHPEFGRIKCKADKLDADWEAGRRGGSDVEMTFVETLDESGLSALNPDVLAITQSAITLLDLDGGDPSYLVGYTASLKQLLQAKGVPLPPYLLAKKVTFSDLIADVKAIANYPALLAYRGQGAIKALEYHAKEIAAAAERSRDAFAWPLTQKAERAKESAFDLRQEILKASKAVGKFTVPAPTTLAGVARQIQGAKMGDLMSLNPDLVQKPEIDTGTVVRYYLDAA